MMGWLLALSAAFAAGGGGDVRAGFPASVVQSLGDGAEVDWTRMVVRITRRGEALNGLAYRAVEQQARERIDKDILGASAAVPVTGDTSLADLLGIDGSAIPPRGRKWVVVEATYLASGSVELVAELSVQDLLVPWSVGRASIRPASNPSSFSGLLIDARGYDVHAVYAPRLVTDEGRVLYAGALWTEKSVSTSPAVWVTDAATPQAARAGDTPLLVRAAAGWGSDIVVPADQVAAVEAIAVAGVLGEGTLVVVVDP